MYRISTLPRTADGAITLQARAEVWNKAWPVLHTAGQREAVALIRQTVKGGGVHRITFSNDVGRAVLKELGLAM